MSGIGGRQGSFASRQESLAPKWTPAEPLVDNDKMGRQRYLPDARSLLASVKQLGTGRGYPERHYELDDGSYSHNKILQMDANNNSILKN